MTSLSARRIGGVLLLGFCLLKLGAVNNALQGNRGALQAAHVLGSSTVPGWSPDQPASSLDQPQGAGFPATGGPLQRVPDLLAIVLAWQGTPDQVAAAWPEAGSSAADRDGVTQLALAQAYFARGFEEEGCLMLRLAGAWRWAYHQGFSRLGAEERREALLWFERAMAVDTELSEEKADLYRYTCRLRARFGDDEGALAACQALMQVAAAGNGAYTEMGNLYVSAGEYEAAREVLLSGLADGDDSLRHDVLLGQAYQGLGEVEAAQTWYERALTFNRHDAFAHLHLGLLLVDLGRPQEAIPHLEEAAQATEPYYASYRERAQRTLSKIR